MHYPGDKDDGLVQKHFPPKRCTENIAELYHLALTILALESWCKVLLQYRATAVDFTISPRDVADQSSGRDEHRKNHRSAFKFPLIPSGFDAHIIISQGFQRLLIRMHSNIYSVFKHFAGWTNYCIAKKNVGNAAVIRT